jgi:hypothetical protein
MLLVLNGKAGVKWSVLDAKVCFLRGFLVPSLIRGSDCRRIRLFSGSGQRPLTERGDSERVSGTKADSKEMGITDAKRREWQLKHHAEELVGSLSIDSNTVVALLQVSIRRHESQYTRDTTEGTRYPTASLSQGLGIYR